MFFFSIDINVHQKQSGRIYMPEYLEFGPSIFITFLFSIASIKKISVEIKLITSKRTKEGCYKTVFRYFQLQDGDLQTILILSVRFAEDYFASFENL